MLGGDEVNACSVFWATVDFCDRTITGGGDDGGVEVGWIASEEIAGVPGGLEDASTVRTEMSAYSTRRRLMGPWSARAETSKALLEYVRLIMTRTTA